MNFIRFSYFNRRLFSFGLAICIALSAPGIMRQHYWEKRLAEAYQNQHHIEQPADWNQEAPLSYDTGKKDFTPLDEVDGIEDGGSSPTQQGSLNPTEQRALYRLLHLCAQEPVMGLMKKKEELTMLGQRLNQHPWLDTLSFIATNPRLKSDYKRIYKRGIVWKQFSQRIADRLNEEVAEHRYQPDEVVHFSQKTGLNQVEVEKQLQSGKTEKILENLAKN